MLRNITVGGILMLLTGISSAGVIFSSRSACAVTGSTAKISCKFTTPNYSSVTQKEWQRFQSHGKEARVLDTDPQYSGRVSVSAVKSDCDLTLNNVSVFDTGFYNFRFKTRTSDWISDTFGVYLTVTDLQVKVEPKIKRQKEVKLSCSSTCPLSTSLFYWYRNGQLKKPTTESSIMLDSTRPSNVGNYSCGVNESSHRSPPVCVLGKECWSVSYALNHVCTLKGTSIDLSSSYKHPADHTVTKSVWFIKQQTDGEPVDMREDDEYQGRVRYTHSSPNNCTLRINKLKETDTQTYRMTIYDDGTDFTGEPGVSLSVTGLRVTITQVGETVTLSCKTTCALSNNPTYIWYKNGQRVSECKSASCSVAAVYSSVSYSCAVEGHDSLRSPPVYSPKNTKAAVLSPGDPAKGDTVTLSCTSEAKPPVDTYAWFMQRATADTLLTEAQNYSISNISSQHSGLYYCTAHNLLGHHNSTHIHLDVLAEVWKVHAVWGAVVLIPALLLSLLAVALCFKRKRGAKINNRCVPKPEDDTYTELNPATMSPDYEILLNVQDSANDSYTPMKPVTPCEQAK